MLARVADSCFWLSRYIERAETNARILDVNMQLMLDFEDQNPNMLHQHWQPVLATLEDQELFSKHHEKITPDSVMEFVTFEKKNPNAIISCIAARENARTVREQISSEMWEQLNRTFLYLRDGMARADFQDSPIDFYRGLVDKLHAFQGTSDATMIHGEGWDFLQLGKYVERADSTSRVLDIKYHILLPSGEQVGGHVDITQWMAVLRSCSALEAYLEEQCRRGLELAGGRVPDPAWRISAFDTLSAPTSSTTLCIAFRVAKRAISAMKPSVFAECCART